MSTTTKNTTNDKAKTVSAYVKKLGYKIKATENDKTKKKRFTVIGTRNKIEKSLCTITYSCKGDAVRINTGVKYKGSTYHEGWSGPYSSVTAYTKLNDILAELQEIKFTDKKAETKQTKTTTKQTKADLKAELNALADATKQNNK